MGRKPCCSKVGLNRGAWTSHEDEILAEYIRVHGDGRWRNLPKKAGLNRCGKSCRLRWKNYLRPDIKRGNISPEEEDLIIRLHKLLGNKWALIAGRLPGRTDNEIKNYWNTTLAKKIKDVQKKKNTISHSSTPNEKTSKAQLAIRTKASKCSKVLFINPLPHSSTNDQLMQNKTEHNELGQPSTTNVYDNAFLNDDEEKQQPPMDSLTDLNVGDICLSDLLNSDFSNMCDFSNFDNNVNISDQTSFFLDEILKDWTQTNFADEEEANNVGSSTWLIQSGEEE